VTAYSPLAHGNEGPLKDPTVKRIFFNDFSGHSNFEKAQGDPIPSSYSLFYRKRTFSNSKKH
jgi:hypothetical protein